MKMVGVDLDLLKVRKEQLQIEIQQIDQVLSILEGKNGASPIQTVEIPQKSKTFTAGYRKAILMHLFTGPCKIEELAKALNWDMRMTATVLNGAVRGQFVAEDKGMFVLTTLGLQAAKWFQRNPKYLTYKHQFAK